MRQDAKNRRTVTKGIVQTDCTEFEADKAKGQHKCHKAVRKITARILHEYKGDRKDVEEDKGSRHLNERKRDRLVM